MRNHSSHLYISDKVGLSDKKMAECLNYFTEPVNYRYDLTVYPKRLVICTPAFCKNWVGNSPPAKI